MFLTNLTPKLGLRKEARGEELAILEYLDLAFRNQYVAYEYLLQMNSEAGEKKGDGK
jgi:hypothetical protein